MYLLDIHLIEPAHPNSDLENLKKDLSFLQSRFSDSEEKVDAKLSLMEDSIAKFIRLSHEKRRHKKEVEIQMRTLCYEDVIIPTALRDWCLKKVKEIYEEDKESVETLPAVSTPVVKPEIQSLFDTDSVYHSMLLCDMVTSYNEKNYADFFSKQVTGNSFQELSFSISDTESTGNDIFNDCIIAKNKKKLFIAFRGELDLSEWHQRYSSFESGK